MKIVKIIPRILFALAGLYLVACAHTFGHFIAAKLLGISLEPWPVGTAPELFLMNIGGNIFQLAGWPIWCSICQFPQLLGEKLPGHTKVLIILAGIFVNIVAALGLFAYLGYSKQKHTGGDYSRSSSWLGNLVLAAAPDNTLSVLRSYGDGLYGLFPLINHVIFNGWRFWTFIFALLNLNFGIWGLFSLILSLAHGGVEDLASLLLFVGSPFLRVIIYAPALIASLFLWYVGLHYLLAGRVKQRDALKQYD